MNIGKFKKSEKETDKIKSGLDELKIMKMDTKEELEETRSELMSLKRMARFKIRDKKNRNETARTRIKTKARTKIYDLISQKLGQNYELTSLP